MCMCEGCDEVYEDVVCVYEVIFVSETRARDGESVFASALLMFVYDVVD